MPVTHAHQRTTVVKPAEFQPGWRIVDATDRVVGRLASDIAMALMGKDKPNYTPHVDMGDFIVVVNVDKVHFTGRKWEQKTYAWYTGWPRQRTITAEKRAEKRPELILTEAVRRMLPKNKLASKMLSKLKVYAGPDHPHQAQQPVAAELGAK